MTVVFDRFDAGIPIEERIFVYLLKLVTGGGKRPRRALVNPISYYGIFRRLRVPNFAAPDIDEDAHPASMRMTTPVGTIDVIATEEVAVDDCVFDGESNLEKRIRLLDPDRCDSFAHAEAMMLRWGEIASRLEQRDKS